MKLTEITVQNYRSINKQTKFSVGDMTTLVGPNNEGKSNLLRALSLGMDTINRWSTLPARLRGSVELTGADAMVAMRGRFIRGYSDDNEVRGYNWKRDFPLQKQESRGAHPTLIRLNFELSETEINDLQSTIGLRNNGHLPIEIQFSRGKASFGVVKPGKGAATHRAKASEIAQFISSRISFVSIPAVRTSRQAQGLVNDLARLRLRSVAQSEDYVRLTAALNELRRAAVSSIGDGLAESVRRYLPSVQGIELTTANVEEDDAIQELFINDGILTSLENKGDGIKSLVSMALIHELAQERAGRQSVILAVDEPEAHLHPSSVHELQTLFQQLSISQQVILATHNPVFVNRDFVASNILVRGNEARPARSVRQIRESIGVRLYDNLESAESVVLVEGLTDEKILPHLLAAINPKFKNAFSSGRIVFKATRGAGKMRVQVQREKSTLCKIYTVFDNDQAGREEAKALTDSGLLAEKFIFLLGDPAMKSSEIEDLLPCELYLVQLSEAFGRPFVAKMFSNRSIKWSQNFEKAAISAGIPINGGATVDRAKMIIADAVISASDLPLSEEVIAHLDVLCGLLIDE